MRKLFFCVAMFSAVVCYADVGRNQGAVNNLCQNLSAACTQGSESSCGGYKTTGCACNESGVCTRGNYSN
jgi:hypothetical protein